MRPNLTLTYGMPHGRADVSRTSRMRTRWRCRASALRPTSSPATSQWSPRAGFNCDLSGNGSQQIRGGVGLFTGRPAYVWISNQFGNTGIDFTRIGAGNNTANRIPFVADPLNQPTTVTGATAGTFSNEIDMIDPDFKYPSVLRGNIGYDHTLPGGHHRHRRLRVVEDDQGHQVPEPEPGAGRRCGWRRRPAVLRDATVTIAERRDPAREHRPGIQLEHRVRSAAPVPQRLLRAAGRIPTAWRSRSWTARPTRRHRTGATSTSRGIRTTPPLARSNFDPGHRITATARTTLPWARREADGRDVLRGTVGPSVHPHVRPATSTATTASPTTCSTSRPRATRSPTPAGTYQDFIGLAQRRRLPAQATSGQIIPRNACRAPWTNTLDGRFGVQLPFKRVKAEITLDVLNLINLFDSQERVIPVPCRSVSDFSSRRRFQHYGDVAQPLTGYNLTTLCRRRSALPARRSALALADSARRPHPVLARIYRVQTNARSSTEAGRFSFIDRPPDLPASAKAAPRSRRSASREGGAYWRILFTRSIDSAR